MITSTYYNSSFKDAIRGKATVASDHALNEGYDRVTDSYLLPHGFKGDYTDALKKDDLFRRYGTVIRTTDSDGYIQTVTSTADAQITAENAAYPEDGDSFDTIGFSAYKIAVLAKLHNSFVSDMAFDIEAYLGNEFARRFGRAEEQLFINGTGVDEPAGLLGSAEPGVITASNTTITGDEIVSLYLSLKPEYRKNGVWLMNDETALMLRTLKDGSGAYLWRCTDDTIFGKPVLCTPYMPNVSAGTLPVAFGDLSFYWILERKPLHVRILTERYAVSGLTGFAAHERLDGKLIRPEAVKTLQMAE